MIGDNVHDPSLRGEGGYKTVHRECFPLKNYIYTLKKKTEKLYKKVQVPLFKEYMQHFL